MQGAAFNFWLGGPGIKYWGMTSHFSDSHVDFIFTKRLNFGSNLVTHTVQSTELQTIQPWWLGGRAVV